MVERMLTEYQESTTTELQSRTHPHTDNTYGPWRVSCIRRGGIAQQTTSATTSWCCCALFSLPANPFLLHSFVSSHFIWSKTLSCSFRVTSSMSWKRYCSSTVPDIIESIFVMVLTTRPDDTWKNRGLSHLRSDENLRCI